MEGTDKFRLPTEAEWEYACRAGSTTRFSFGDDEGKLGEYAWYSKNSSRSIHPAGQKRSNNWGLYDMYGNVWEWCQDWYGEYPSWPETDPQGPSWGAGRVVRGGGWCYYAQTCRSATRVDFAQDRSFNALGFRLAMMTP